MRRATWLLSAIGACVIGCSRPAPPPPPPPAAPAPPPELAVVDAGPVVLPEPEPPEEPLRPDAAPETVTIKLVAEQRRQAHVFWGRKDLGIAPLELTRPRGSGPMDLLVVADGYLPLHTRVFTERNETLALRLYDRDEAARLPGYSPSESSPESGNTASKTTTTKTNAKTGAKPASGSASWPRR